MACLEYHLPHLIPVSAAQLLGKHHLPRNLIEWTLRDRDHPHTASSSTLCPHLWV